MDIKTAIEQATGKTVIELEDYTELWLQWFKGDVEKFHHYIEYNGISDVKLVRRTLNMPKKCCEDWANLLLNEKTDVTISNGSQVNNKLNNNQDNLNNLLNKVRFWTKGNEGIEKTFALGNGAFVESFTDDGKPKFQFVNKTKMYPLTVEDDVITECAFVNVNSYTVKIQIHYKDNFGNYIIRTLIGEKTNNDLVMHFGEPDYDYSLNTGSKLPWFQCLKPNIANNIEIDSPLGISVYANAVSELEGIDLAYDAFCNELENGKLKTFVDKQLTNYSNGNPVPIFNNRQTHFYMIGNGDDTKEPLKFYAPTLRTDSYINAINNALNLFSTKVGFGSNHYRFDQSGISTATQVISENSEMFRTLKKHEIILNDVIIGAVRALIYICNNFCDGEFRFENEDNLNIEVKFDDSIIEDKESQKASDRQDVTMNIMSKAEYRSKWYNEDIETAQAEIDKINANVPNINNFFSDGGI